MIKAIDVIRAIDFDEDILGVKPLENAIRYSLKYDRKFSDYKSINRKMEKRILRTSDPVLFEQFVQRIRGLFNNMMHATIKSEKHAIIMGQGRKYFATQENGYKKFDKFREILQDVVYILRMQKDGNVNLIVHEADRIPSCPVDTQKQAYLQTLYYLSFKK
jgi:hypothetical protein